MFRTLLMLALLAAPGLARADDDDAAEKAAKAAARAEKAAAERAAAVAAKLKAALTEKEKAAQDEKDRAAAAQKEAAAAITKYKAAVAAKEAAAREEKEKAAAGKARIAKATAGEDRLAVLEQKLQALLKEIQSLRGAQGEPKKVEKREIVGRIADSKAGTPLQLHFELKDGKLAAPKAAAGPLRVQVEMKDGGKPRIVVVGPDGKPQTVDVEKLKDLKLGELKIEGFEKFKELADVEKLKAMGALKAAQEKLKGLTLDDGAKAKVADKLNAEKLKALGADGKRVVIVDGATGKIIRTEEAPPAKDEKKKAPATTPASPAGLTVKPPQPTVGFAFSSDASTIHLTRVTYALSGEQARALDEFLKAFVKAQVLETKVAGDKLVVTTTPDVQSTIGQVVGLMSGKPAAARFRVTNVQGGTSALFAAPKSATVPAAPRAVTPPKPAKAAEPAKPVKPAEPAKPKKKEKKDEDDDDK